MNPLILSFFLYFLILLLIGLVSHKRQRTSADFIMGNRSLSFWLTALTAHASDMSSWLFMALPAVLFLNGVPEIWIALGLILGMFFNWQFVAEKIRNETERLNSYTLSTYFEKRFEDTSGVIRLVTAVMTLVFMAVYLASGLIAMGILLEALFGINYYLGLSVAVSVVVIYTFTGGFVTVAWTDFCQGMFLLFSILIVPTLAFEKVGGMSKIAQVASDAGISLHLIKDFSFETFLSIFFLASWGLGYFGQPHIITKFMGIKHPSEIYKSKYFGMTWQILTLGAAAFCGVVGIAFFEEQVIDPQLVFVELVKALFSPLAGGFILCGIIAASMSTMDSQLLVSASVLSEDIYKHLFRKKASPKSLLRASRMSIILVAVVSLGIAFFKSATIMEVVQYAWTGLGCSFGPLVLMALYSKKTTRAGAIAGIIVGGFIAGLWPVINPWMMDRVIPSMIPGFLGSLGAIWAVSRLSQEKL
ncbi:MAG: sodium/proline symporter [Chlamydiia bacterium]|nr:sodium/proline symporter [Chlamydiia bacterium]